MAWLLVLAAVLGPTGAAWAVDRAALEEQAAGPDARAAAEALFALGEMEDEAGEYASAVTHYRAAVLRLPSLQHAPRAMARLAWLESHAEGSFEPLARLERVRRDPAAARDPAAIDALARDAEAFPPGLVRVEARMLVASAYLHRLGRTAEGCAELRLVIDDPHTDALTRRQASRELADARLDARDFEGAESAARGTAFGVDARLVAYVATRVRRHHLHVAAWLDLALAAALASVSIARAALRGSLGAVFSAAGRTARVALVFAAYIALAGGALASLYERGNARPFFAIGAALVPLATVSRAWAAASSARVEARIGRAVIAASTVLAAAFLVLESIDGAYLEAFGL